MSDLRSRLVRLAFDQPTLRKPIVGLLREAGLFDGEPFEGAAKDYRVVYTVTVDRPELRGPTYPVVEAGKRVTYTDNVRDWRTAKRRYEELISGDDDFESEYVSYAQAWASYKSERGRYHRRTIGPAVARTRDERTGRIVEKNVKWRP